MGTADTVGSAVSASIDRYSFSAPHSGL